MEYTNINKEKTIVKNKGIFIFKPMLKIKNLILNKNGEYAYSYSKKTIYNSLLCNNDKVENKTEITGIFNSKGEYEINIGLENNSTVKYNVICEEDSKEKYEFPPEDLDRYKFNELLENENLVYINQKSNSFIVKNKEIFIFEFQKFSNELRTIFERSSNDLRIFLTVFE